VAGRRGRPAAAEPVSVLCLILLTGGPAKQDPRARQG